MINPTAYLHLAQLQAGRDLATLRKAEVLFGVKLSLQLQQLFRQLSAVCCIKTNVAIFLWSGTTTELGRHSAIELAGTVPKARVISPKRQLWQASCRINPLFLIGVIGVVGTASQWHAWTLEWQQSHIKPAGCPVPRPRSSVLQRQRNVNRCCSVRCYCIFTHNRAQWCLFGFCLAAVCVCACVPYAIMPRTGKRRETPGIMNELPVTGASDLGVV